MNPPSNPILPSTAPQKSDLQKKVFIKTYGCQMNVYDSERMGDALTTSGYIKTDDAEDADLVLVNTCHIREKATEKIYSEIGRLRKLRKRRQANGADLKIAIAGCVAQAEGEAMIKRAPEVDLVIGPQTYHLLPQLLKRTHAGEKIVETEFSLDDKYALLPAPQEKRVRAGGVTAFLTVQEGCDKFCSFCVVPYTRGNEQSRSVAQITAEAEKLVANGVRELTLLGQNVNAWHGVDKNGSEVGLAALLEALSNISDLKRLRYTTSHPRDMDEALINAHRDLPKLMPFLHLPVQSGSDLILKAMNRRHTADDYRRTIEKIKHAQPRIALSSDFIVGFPGETDSDFEATLQLICDVGFASAYSFKYSARPGTPAADLGTDIENSVADARLVELQNLINAQQAVFLGSLVGTTMDVLVEKQGRETGQFIGRSPWLIPVVMPQNNGNIGEIVSVRIGEAGRNTLNAEGLVQSSKITGGKAA